jgi:hypothetical protein
LVCVAASNVSRHRFTRAQVSAHTASTGVYNPISCTWIVPPANAKAAATLDFSPTKLFADKAFVQR